MIGDSVIYRYLHYIESYHEPYEVIESCDGLSCIIHINIHEAVYDAAVSNYSGNGINDEAHSDERPKRAYQLSPEKLSYRYRHVNHKRS